jgi:hypothetical protein
MRPPQPRKVTRRGQLAVRCLAAVFDFILRLSPPRAISAEDLQRADFRTHPGGKGLRFTKRLREVFRRRWLRLRT